MSKDAEKLLLGLKAQVFKSQASKLQTLKDKYVVRSGVTFLVTGIDWRKGKIEVSDTKTPLNQKTTFSIKSFLSKAVVEVPHEVTKRNDHDRGHRSSSEKGKVSDGKEKVAEDGG